MTVVADGLSSSTIVPSLFPELGPAKNVFQVPNLAVIEYETYNVMVQVEERRLVVTDSTSEPSIASPIAAMMSHALQASQGVKVAAVGFNYVYELLVLQGTGLELVASYINTERFRSLGTIESGGFRVTFHRNERLVQLNVEPVWKQPSMFNVVLNQHFENGQNWEPILARFEELTSETPDLLRQVFNGA